MFKGLNKLPRITVLTTVALTSIFGCQNKPTSIQDKQNNNITKNFVSLNDGTMIDKNIGDDKIQFTVLNHSVLAQKLVDREYLQPTATQAKSLLASKINSSIKNDAFFSDKKDREKKKEKKDTKNATPDFTNNFINNLILPPAQSNPSLYVSIPLGLIGESSLFGGVITKVSDREKENLGMLKLTDITPIHVKTEIVKDPMTQKLFLGLSGCLNDCRENDPNSNEPLLALPIVAVDTEKKLVTIDLSELGSEMDIMSILDRDGQATNLKTVEAKTVAVDYNFNTLAMDVESRMQPVRPNQEILVNGVNPNPAPTNVPDTYITARWYLKLASKFSPSFVPRPATAGVGFFMTERSAESKVQRWSIEDLANRKVKYFIKNVPEEYKKAFEDSFKLWNETMKPHFNGQDFYEWEFVSADDPRNAVLVPGDVRYNIVEWDLVNKAPYGGLGPSIANQFTGEIMTANVLVQGPTILDIYRKWYGVNLTANALKEIGRNIEADSLLLKKQKEIEFDYKKLHQTKSTLSARLSEKLKFNIHSQESAYADPLMLKNDFEIIPTGVSFEQYMYGYFIDMLAHELGHNIGLRHNFRGNLGAEGDKPELGKVSRSIMEYLGRGYRYLDRISSYDTMAIAYGYLGAAPKFTNWFCTDEEALDMSDSATSAECSRDDATNDPFSFHEIRLGRAVDLIINRGQASASTWKVEDMMRELGNTVKGLGHYAFSAEKTADSWTNFFNKLDRPKSKLDVKNYVVAKIKSKICDPSINSEILAKTSIDDRFKTKMNIDTLRATVFDILKPYGIFTAEELKCE